MGATRGVLVTDPALGGSCTVATARVLAAALKTLEFDLVLAGVDTSDGVGRRRRRPASRRSPGCRTCPTRRRSSPTRPPDGPRPAHHRRPATTSSRRRCRRSSPARRRSASRATRRSRGSWPRAPRRSRRCRWPTSASTRRRSGAAGAHDQGRRLAAAGGPRRDRGRPRGARRGGPPGRRLPRRAEAHLMAGIWVHRRDRAGDGSLDEAQHRGRHARPGARGRGRRCRCHGRRGRRRSRQRGRGARRVSCRASWRVTRACHGGSRRRARSSAQRLAALVEEHDPDIVILSAPARKAATSPAPCPRSPGCGVLANATAVRWARRTAPSRRTACSAASSSPRARSRAGRGIITVRPNSVTAEPAGSSRARSRAATVTGELQQPAGPRRRSRRRRGAARAPIDDARIIVAGGRGVGGPDGLRAHRGPRDGARRRGRGDARGRRFGLDPVQPADRPDRQDREAPAVPRDGHQRRDPAQGRDADRSHDRRGQPRPGRPDRRFRRHDRASATWSRSARRCSPSCGRGPAEPARGPRRMASSPSSCRSRRSSRWQSASLVVLRRAGRIVARTREVEGFRSAVRELPTRIDHIARRRRRPHRRRAPPDSSAPDTIAATIEAATDAVERYADEARALNGPPRPPSRSATTLVDGPRAGRPRARDGRARRDDPGPGRAAAVASSRRRRRSSAATSTCSTPARRSPGTPQRPRSSIAGRRRATPRRPVPSAARRPAATATPDHTM